MTGGGVRRAATLVGSALFAAAGGAALVRRGRRQRGERQVVILEYHDVGAGGHEPEGTVSASRFRRHLRYLARHHRLVSLSDAVAMLQEPGGLAEDVVVVTFDDGYLGNYRHAWPVLREERTPATVFVCTGFLDGRDLWFDIADRCFESLLSRRVPLDRIADRELRAAGEAWRRPAARARARRWLKSLPPARRDALLDDLRPLCEPLRAPARPLSWDAVREMRDGGVEIGCHTASHPILSTLDRGAQEQEVVTARDRIAAEIGAVPRLFAYPNGAAGDFTQETVEVVREAGFRAACTTRRLPNRAGGDLFRLSRIGVGSEPCVVLGARLAGLFDEGVRTRLQRIGFDTGGASRRRTSTADRLQ